MDHRIYFFAFAFALVVCSNALTISPFENLTSGIWDEWNQANPENVKRDQFGMVSDKDKLWLVSRRLFRQDFSNPWDPASRGGIVSTLHVSNLTWTHSPYDRLDEDHYGDKLFSLYGRLFMLTYNNSQDKIGYHKLFFFNDDDGHWTEISFDIDPASTTNSSNYIQQLVVNVPDPSGKVAYFAASAHAYGQRGSEMVYSKLNIDFDGNIPIKATLQPIARVDSFKPSAVVFTAVHDNVLYGFVQHFFSEGYVSEYGMAYTIDLVTGQVGNVSLGGASPPMTYSDGRVFQTKDGDILIVGGYRMVDLGQLEDVKDIWSLKLDWLEWRGTNALIPNVVGSEFAFDQENGHLYAADLRNGVSVAKVQA